MIVGVNGDKILIWEKNGLIHGDFNHFLSDQITQLEFSNDGEILAIASKSRVSLYYRSNYHWYLKKTYQRTSPKIYWDDIILVILANDVERIKFIWRHDVGGGKAVVVDGENLNITCFNQGLIPPPMFHESTTIGFVPELLAINSNGKIGLSCMNKIYIHDGSLNQICELEGVKHLSFAEDRLFASNETQVFEITDGKPLFRYEFNKEIILLRGESSDNIWIEFFDGDIYKNNELFNTLPEVCEKIIPIHLEEKQQILGLSGTKLYLGKNILCINCTSAEVYGPFLLFTKQSAPLSELYLFNINFPVPFNLRPNQPAILPEPSADHYYSRGIEKGSVLVTLNGVNAILEHSRGNLEGIYPRLVLIFKVKELIDKTEYGNAFKLMRTHKLDLNFVYDLDPEKFMTNLDKFINEVSRVDYLNLFLTSLKDQDWAAIYLKRDLKDSTGKTNKICDAIREKLDQNTQILSILTSYATKNPPELESALQWIQHIREKYPKKPPRPPHMHEGKRDDKVYPEDALKYLS